MGKLKEFFQRKKAMKEEGFEDVIPAHEHDHSAIEQADPYRWEIAHKRLVLLFKFSFFLNVFFLLSFASAYELIAALVEKHEPKVALLRMDDKTKKIYHIEPVSETTPGFPIFMQGMAERYVGLMLEVDETSQAERFQEAFRMTDQKYYLKFKKKRIDSGEIQKILDDGGVRAITVESVERIENKKDLYKYVVDFIQTTTYPRGKPEVKNVRAFLTMTTRPQKVTEADKYLNPFGAVVLDMSLKEKATQ